MSGCQLTQPASMLKHLVGVYSAAPNRFFNAHDDFAIDGPPIYLCDRLKPLVKIIRYILYRYRCHIKYLPMISFRNHYETTGICCQAQAFRVSILGDHGVRGTDSVRASK
jgi:hypothetical protein